MRARTGRKRWGAIFRRIVFVVGVIMIAGGLVSFLMTRDGVGLLLLCGAGLVLVMFYFLQEGKVWLSIVASRFSEISKLKMEMTSLGKEETGHISIPTDMVEKFAQIQADQIRIGRANAIAEFKSAGELFSVLSSTKVLQQKARLDAGNRLSVEDAIEELMQNPRPSGAKPDSATGSLSYPVAGTDVEIVYAVDEKEHRLRLVELRQPVAEAKRA